MDILGNARRRGREQRLQRLIDGVADHAIVMLDPQGSVVSWNRGAQRLTGYPAEEIVGRHVARAFPPEDRLGAEPQRDLDTAAATGRFEGEGWCLRKDGSRYLANVVIAPLRDDDGVLTGFSMISRDVTEHRTAERALRASEEWHRALVASVADGIVSVDAKGIVGTMNPAAEQMFGYAAEEVLGRNVTMLMPERFREAHDRHVARFAAQMDPEIIGLRREVVGWRRDGQEFPMMLALNVAPDHGATQFVALVTDMTAGKQAQQAIAEAHRRLHSMIEVAPFAIITTDAAGIVDSVNPAAERLTLYPRDELLGGPLARVHDPEEVQVRATELSKMSGRPVAPGLETFTFNARRGLTDDGEWTFVRKDGARVPVQLAITAMRDDDRGIVGYISIAYDISERKRREEYAQHIAHHDFLTGLPMRSLLGDRLQMAVARGRRERSKVGVLMIDLDHFKRVNDSIGHHVGDQLLRIVAERLVGCVRASDTVARLGGDEFIVLVPDVHEVASIVHVAKTLLERIAAPAVVGSHVLKVTPSIGISVYPTDGDTVDELIKHADTAMYRAKANGRSGYTLFTREMERAASYKMELENDLRRALECQELQMHYQPKVSLETGRIIGMEALLRWTDAVRGPVSPAKIIPIAEECGLIQPIGAWVMHTACREARQLQERLGQPLRVSVNVSPRQFLQNDLVDVIQDALREGGLAPEYLEVEITEGVLMENTALAIERLAQIRALGVSIAIDDFGTGFSSLSYITRFQIDTLKIDRSFIANVTESPNDAAVAQAIIALARSLKVKVVAEGVETTGQLAFLRANCCDVAHGDLFGAPVPPALFSVQGFHFAAACSAADFAETFGQLSQSSEDLVRAAVH